MSFDVSIFFSLPEGESDVGELVRRTLRLALDAPTGMEPSRTICAGFRFSLIADHDLEDDMGIPFSAYKFQLSVMPVRPSVAGAYAAQDHLGIYLGALLRASGVPCIVVDNLQRILEEP